MRTQILALLFVMIVTCCATVLPAIAAEDSAIGSFTVINAAPTVTDVVLYNSDESYTDFALRITVADANTLNDIASVVIELEEQDIATEKATFLWTAAEGWVDPEGRWSIKEAACKVPGELTETSGDWWLYFSTGKLASQWKIKATATDSGSASGNCTTTADTSFANTVDEQRVYFEVFDALPFRDESGSLIYVSFRAVVENQYKNLPNASILIDVSGGASADENFTIFSGSLTLNRTETQFNYVPLMDQKSEKYVFQTKVIADGIVYAVSSVRTVESYTSDRI
jgi:hypothetical protein